MCKRVRLRYVFGPQSQNDTFTTVNESDLSVTMSAVIRHRILTLYGLLYVVAISFIADSEKKEKINKQTTYTKGRKKRCIYDLMSSMQHRS